MGMAASQARFLGLTARKSNVEYQVQQINQQRTSLANESAGLYNQMMELSVPTPPSVNSFYNTKYVLDNSASSGYSSSDYSISSMTKTYQNNGEYSVDLTSTVTEMKPSNTTFNFRSISEEDGVYSIMVKKKDATLSTSLTYDPTASAYKNGSLNFEANQIYAIEADGQKPDGFDLFSAEEQASIKYFFKDDSNKYYYLTEQDLFGTKVSDDPETYNGGLLNNNLESIDDDNFTLFSSYLVSKEKITPVKATIETASNGRLTTIAINDDESYPEDLRGMTFSLSSVQEYDEIGYTQAMNDYEYEKAMYEKAISDINSKTESIQAKDQSLELKIQQLDTEQNAIATEMDSVTKIIDDNVQKTFNVFG